MRVISSNDLKRKLAAFQDYYNLHRMRRSLAAVRLLSGMVVRGGCLQRWIGVAGTCIVAGSFRRLSRPDLEFATHSIPLWYKMNHARHRQARTC